MRCSPCDASPLYSITGPLRAPAGALSNSLLRAGLLSGGISAQPGAHDAWLLARNASLKGLWVQAAQTFCITLGVAPPCKSSMVAHAGTPEGLAVKAGSRREPRSSASARSPS